MKYVHKNLAHNNQCALILDVHPSHRTQKVTETAGRLKIELIYVPANGTGIFQPLDNKIYGILKSKLRAAANTKYFLKKYKKYSSEKFALHLLIFCH